MRIFVIDFEGSLKCGVIEYGVVVMEDQQILDTQTGLCRPERPIHPQDILVHGLRDDMLCDQPFFSSFRDQFQQYRYEGVLAAHHAPIENAFLSRYWHTVSVRHRREHPCPSKGSWGPWIDSRIVYQRYYDLADYSLQSLIQRFDLQKALDTKAAECCPVDRCKPHCALFDALASALLLQATSQHIGLGPDEWLRASQPVTAEDAAQADLF